MEGFVELTNVAGKSISLKISDIRNIKEDGEGSILIFGEKEDTEDEIKVKESPEEIERRKKDPPVRPVPSVPAELDPELS